MTESRETKDCPFCGETILKVAKKCKHCQEFLDNETSKMIETVDSNKAIIVSGEGAWDSEKIYDLRFIDRPVFQGKCSYCCNIVKFTYDPPVYNSVKSIMMDSVMNIGMFFFKRGLEEGISDIVASCKNKRFKCYLTCPLCKGQNTICLKCFSLIKTVVVQEDTCQYCGAFHGI